MDELMANVREAMAGVLEVMQEQGKQPEQNIQIPDIAVKAVTGPDMCRLVEADGWLL